MIKNIIFDFGQVIVKFDEEYITSAYVEGAEDIKTVTQAVFDRSHWNRLDEGSITDGEVRQIICASLPDHLKAKGREVYDNWFRNLPFIEGIPEIIKGLKAKGYNLFLLSNISSYFADNYKSVDGLDEIFAEFDGLVFSGPLKIFKPNKEIFDYTLEKYNLKAEECLFIDDNANNIEGARRQGINTYLFDGNAAALADFLNKL